MPFKMSGDECLRASLGAYGVRKFTDTNAHVGQAVAVKAVGGDVTVTLIDDGGITWSGHVIKDGDVLPGCWTSVQRTAGGTGIIVFNAPGQTYSAWT